MNENEWLAERFETERTRLTGVAFRMLGSLSEADDAVQESWLRLSRSGATGVENLSGWLTTVVARVCLNMLRSRKSRREESLEAQAPRLVRAYDDGTDPEHEALLADSVGLALLVVLETLTPAERLAFVLHDTFAVPFDEIAPLVGRSPAAARQLASRARRRVRGSASVPRADLARQRRVVDAFLAASRAGDFDALLAVLDPDVVFRVDATANATGGATQLRGATAVARGATAYASRARFTQVALVNGNVGVVLAPRGRLFGVGVITIRHGRIVEAELVADPERLRQLEIAVLDDQV
jgi:RNA polymerase sigma-70 factor, ECF subfamily